jgi:pantothenate kinase
MQIDRSNKQKCKISVKDKGFEEVSCDLKSLYKVCRLLFATTNLLIWTVKIIQVPNFDHSCRYLNPLHTTVLHT